VPATAGEDRPLRADARRNRDRLLDVAVRAFSRGGDEATLDAIAKEAGVGIGTLYRHFPTREALVEAAYRSELDRLCEPVPELLEATAPDEALRAWMDRFVEYMTTKHGMADALSAVIASGGNPFEHSRDKLVTALGLLLGAGARAGSLRSDIAPVDLLVSLSGITLIAEQLKDPEQAGRMLDLLMDGLRYRKDSAH